MGKKLFLSLIVGVLLVVVGVLVLGAESSNNISHNNSEDLIVFNNKSNENKEIAIASPVAINEFETVASSQVERNKKLSIDKEVILNTTVPIKKIKPTKKPIFDAMLYDNKNINNEVFFKPIKILYDRPNVDPNEPIDIEHFKKVAESLPKSSIPYIIDIERWNVHGSDDEEANKNIDKYILVISTMKKVRPDLKFGYYGVLPNRDYWSILSNDPRKVYERRHINDRLKRLVPYVDVVCPSLYTFYNDSEAWKKYASEIIRQAKEYGKPVYPFLWPQYHQGGDKALKFQFIDSKFWKMQLSLVYQGTDGVIIWGAWDLSPESVNSRDWKENAAWWRATKEFINEKNMKE